MRACQISILFEMLASQHRLKQQRNVLSNILAHSFLYNDNNNNNSNSNNNDNYHSNL